MSEAGDKPSNATDRRIKSDRRLGRERRSGIDRRKIDLGPPDGVERRTGWERRISERRLRGDRRTPPPLAPTRPTLQGVMLGNLRLLVSRLYHHAERSRPAARDSERLLAELRQALLRPDPDLGRVGGGLESLEGSALAELPEFKLAQELLAHAGTEGPVPALSRHELVEVLHEILQSPLPPKPCAHAPKDRTRS